MDPKLKELFETIDSLKTDAIDKITDLANKQLESHDEVVALITAVEEKFETLKTETQKQITERSISVPGLEDEKEKKKFSFQRAFAAIAQDKNFSKAPFEKEVFDAVKQRAVEIKDATVTGTTGVGFWVPQELSSEFVDLALASVPLIDMVTTIRGLVGDLTMPVMLTRPDAEHKAESAASGKIDYTWGERRWTPKRLTGYTKIGNLALIQTGNALEPIIRDAIMKSMRIRFHKALVDGTGAASQPKGITQYSGDFTATDQIGTNGGLYTIADASNQITDMEEADHQDMDGRFAFLMRPIVRQGMTQERIPQFSGQTDGMYVINPPRLSNAQVEDIIGFPIKTTTHLSKTLTKGSSTDASQVIFGDWSEMVVAFWQGLELKISTEASDPDGNSAFLNDETWIVANQYYDINVKDRTRFNMVSDARTTRSAW